MKIPRLTLKTPEECFSGLWGRVPRETKLTFAASVILGFVVHIYMFVNKLPNHDDVNHLFYADYGTASGRWLLPFILGLDGPFSTPWLIGLLSVLCLAGTVCFTTSLLRIRHPLGCIVTAAVMVAFPAVTATFTYMFTADAYFFSLLLAAFGAYAAVRMRWGEFIGAAAITLSLGIYQSYLGVAAALMVGALLFETLDGKLSFKELFLKGLRLLGSLALALAAYMVIVRITTRDAPLVDYMGISEMGKISLRELPALVWHSYHKYITFFLKNDSGYHFGFLKYAFAAAGVCTVGLGAWLLWKRRLGPARTVLAAALVGMYPLAADLIYVMVPKAEIHTLMIYGLVLILVAPVALADYMEIPKASGGPAQAAAGWIILLSIALTAYSYIVIANTAYLKIDLSIRQCTAYSTRLLDKIESCEGYQQGMSVILLGSQKREGALSPTPELDRVNMIGLLDMGGLRTSYTYEYFLRYYLGFTGDVATASVETIGIPGVEDMPLYPAAGSIQVIDDMVIVKIND